MAILINSYLPHYLDELSAKYGYKFVHVSTDCVFNGEIGDYDEESIPDETSMYGRTKALGEVVNDRSVTLRTSIVGPDINENGIVFSSGLWIKMEKLEVMTKSFGLV